MATNVSFNGVNYPIPGLAESKWGTNVSNYLIALASGTFQKSGGAFTLTSDVNFGGNPATPSGFGLIARYFKSYVSNIAASGVLRLAVTDTIGWRNNANLADLPLGINGSDQLMFNNVVIADSSSQQTLTNKNFSDSTCQFVNVSDATKALGFSLGTATTGTKTTFVAQQTTNRTMTLPDTSDTFVMLALIQVMKNKLLDATNAWVDTSDNTKKAQWNLSGMTTGKVLTLIASLTNDRSITFPDVTDTLVGLAATQALTNKDYQGGAASNTSRMTLPSGSTSALAALTRKAGTMLYDTSLNVVKYDDGSNLNVLSTTATATPSVAGIVTTYTPTIKSSVLTRTTAYSILDTDGYGVILGNTTSAGFAITLPNPANNTGRQILIKKITDTSSNALTITPFASETIDGASTNVLNTVNSSILLTTDGTNWFVLKVSGSFVRSQVTATGTLTNSTYTDLTSISIPPGTWAITAEASGNATTSMTNMRCAVSTTAGNNTTGLQFGITNAANPGSGTQEATATVPNWMQILTATTTYYLKINITGTGTLNYSGATIQAIRVG